MKIDNFEFELKVNTKKAAIKILALNYAFRKVIQSMDELNTCLEKMQTLEIEYSIVEKKKSKWYQFWK
ncbi:MAG: hypothetical protein WC827_03830 [Candidatus Paceibacterota bacterium]|jgi:hypothetical protein